MRTALILSCLLLTACNTVTQVPPALESDVVDADWLRANYAKTEHMIPMRDGVELYTAVYAPRDEGEYPILMVRTPYRAGPYGPDAYRDSMHPNTDFARDGYIFVFQDVRGKFMSEGDFVNMRPHVAEKSSPSDVDESSDTYDTVAFLIENVPDNNGRVGMWGISYPGFYTAAGTAEHHPALVAVSPQAPIADWWFDDFYHHGAFFLPHCFRFMSGFGKPRPEPTEDWAGSDVEWGTEDGYDFYLNAMGPLKNAQEKFLHGEIPFWNALIEHPTYDEFWQSRNILPHLNDVSPAVLVVGGWFDAEDLYGPLSIYREIEARNPDVDNRIVMGPWRHGGWARTDGSRLGQVHFGGPTSPYFQNEIEKPFFDHHLKGGRAPAMPEALMFETGANEWRRFDEWPPADRHVQALHAARGNGLSWTPPGNDGGYDEFVSDPAKPVPFTEDVARGMTRAYMTDDQRFAGRRPDVVVYQTEPLDEDITIAGPVLADLWVSTSEGDADWVVKLIDVHPGDHEDYPGIREGMRTSGYQMMVRSEVIRGRYRNSYEDPEPFVSNQPTNVRLPLQDVLHTFKRGHRIMIQIQSTWFPLVDRNPQKYVENIFLADEDDYIRATHRIYHDADHPTRIEFGVID